MLERWTRVEDIFLEAFVIGNQGWGGSQCPFPVGEMGKKHSQEQ